MANYNPYKIEEINYISTQILIKLIDKYNQYEIEEDKIYELIKKSCKAAELMIAYNNSEIDL